MAYCYTLQTNPFPLKARILRAVNLQSYDFLYYIVYIAEVISLKNTLFDGVQHALDASTER